MTRWILLGMTILGFVLAFTTHSPALLLIALLVGVTGFVGFVVSLAADRVAANARPEVAMASREDIAAMRKPVPKPSAQTSAQLARAPAQESSRNDARYQAAASAPNETVQRSAT